MDHNLHTAPRRPSSREKYSTVRECAAKLRGCKWIAINTHYNKLWWWWWWCYTVLYDDHYRRASPRERENQPMGESIRVTAEYHIILSCSSQPRPYAAFFSFKVAVGHTVDHGAAFCSRKSAPVCVRVTCGL